MAEKVDKGALEEMAAKGAAVHSLFIWMEMVLQGHLKIVYLHLETLVLAVLVEMEELEETAETADQEACINKAVMPVMAEMAAKVDKAEMGVKAVKEVTV